MKEIRWKCAIAGTCVGEFEVRLFPLSLRLALSPVCLGFFSFWSLHTTFCFFNLLSSLTS